MKRHLSLATTRQHARRRHEAVTSVSDEARGAGDYAYAPGLKRRPQVTSEGPRWRHTLVLKGRLDRCSTLELEEEIECLCEEGVTGLTIDLRQLEAIDSIGVQVIALQSMLYERRGHRVTVIPASTVAYEALERAGARNLVMPASAASVAPGMCELPMDGSHWGRATSMTKDL